MTVANSHIPQSVIPSDRAFMRPACRQAGEPRDTKSTPNGVLLKNKNPL